MPSSTTTSFPSSLTVEGLSVHFGGVQALTDVSLSVRPGECVALVGPNGAGKSTLLNAVSGLARNATGNVLVGDRQCLGMGPPRVRRLGVCRSFQEPRLVDTATVLTNVLAGAHTAFRHGSFAQVLRPRSAVREERQWREHATALLHQHGLGELTTRRCAELPYGTRKHVDILRAVVASPTLLLLDEPSSGLDEHERDQIVQLIDEVRGSTGAAALVVEHHLGVVDAVADRVVVLEGGCVVREGTTAEVLAQEDSGPRPPTSAPR